MKNKITFVAIIFAIFGLWSQPLLHSAEMKKPHKKQEQDIKNAIAASQRDAARQKQECQNIKKAIAKSLEEIAKVQEEANLKKAIEHSIREEQARAQKEAEEKEEAEFKKAIDASLQEETDIYKITRALHPVLKEVIYEPSLCQKNSDCGYYAAYNGALKLYELTNKEKPKFNIDEWKKFIKGIRLSLGHDVEQVKLNDREIEFIATLVGLLPKDYTLIPNILDFEEHTDIAINLADVKKSIDSGNPHVFILGNMSAFREPNPHDHIIAIIATKKAYYVLDSLNQGPNENNRLMVSELNYLLNKPEPTQTEEKTAVKEVL